MSEAGELRVPVLPSGTRRRLVHGGFIAIALLYVGILVIAPLIGIAWAAFQAGWSTIVSTLKQPDVLHAFYLTGVITVITVIVTSVFGVIVALVIARDRFPGRALMSALVDLPLAVSPVIVGLMAVVLFGLGGWFEPWFTSHGIRILFARALDGARDDLHLHPVRDPRGRPRPTGGRGDRGGGGAHAGRVGAPDVLPRDAEEHPLGAALRDRAHHRPVDRRDRRGADRERQLTGQTETATLYVLRAFDQFQDDQGYIVALTLALVSIVLLVLIEIFKRRQERMQRT